MLFNSNHIEIFNAYAQGFFPTLDSNSKFFFYKPENRPLIPISGMHVSKTLKQTIRKEIFEIKFDHDFTEIMQGCVREEQNWITPEVIHLYSYLYKLGYAHCVGCYKDGLLVGGLYGLALGAGFFCESMFSIESDASKVATYHLLELLKAQGFEFLDCQINSPHLESLGAIQVDSATFDITLKRSLAIKTDWGKNLDQIIALRKFSLESERLKMDPIITQDQEDIIKMGNKEEIHHYTLMNPVNTKLRFEQLMKRANEAHKKGIPDALAIRLKDNGKLIGILSIFYPVRELPTLEIAIELDSAFWGKGYAQEAFTKAIDFIKEAYPVHRIQARAVVENTRSNTMLKKVGFDFEGTLKKSFWHNNKIFDLNYYGIPLNR